MSGEAEAEPGEVSGAATVGDSPGGRERAAARGDERYVPIVEIARGGMGRVMEAVDTRLGRRVALKEALSGDAKAVMRFERETRITARLEHPSIVPLYDAGVGPDGARYYVMRRVSGEGLDKKIAAADTLAKRLALLPNIAAAANAIAHAHKRGVLHRDLKPANILVGELGETVVIDWGLAKVIDDSAGDSTSDFTSEDPLATRAGAVFGTPGFMSPEQVTGKELDARTDVFALGATLYYVLTASTPHTSSSTEGTLVATASAPVRPIAEAAPGVPRDLAWIVDKALAFDPEQRYRDAAALAADLQQFLTGQLVASRSYSWRERLVRFVRRHKLALAAVATATVIAIGVAVYAFTRVISERETARDALAASEKANAQAAERLDDSLLAQARMLLVTNPTAAVALVKQLARGERWREAHAIGIAGRATGACRGMPGPARPDRLVLSPDGMRAASTGSDGDIWLHDLAAGSSRQLAKLKAFDLRVTWVGERLVAHNVFQAIVFDPDGTRREVRFPPLTHTTAGNASGLFAVTLDDRIYRIDPATGAQRAVPAPPAKEVAPSPDGRWLAVAGPSSLAIVDLADPSAVAVRVLEVPTPRRLRWNDRSSLLVMWTGEAENGETVVVGRALLGWGEVARTERVVAVLFDDGLPYGQRDGAFIPLLDSKSRTQVAPHRSSTPTVRAFTREHGRVSSVAGGRILVDVADARAELIAPGEVSAVAAAANSRYIAALVAGRLVVWDGDVAVPRTLPVHLPFTPEFGMEPYFVASGPAHVAVGVAERAQWSWIDLAAGTERLGTAAGGFASTVAAGDVLVEHRNAAIRAQLGNQADELTITPLGGTPWKVRGDAEVVDIAGTRVFAGTRTGKLQELDLEKRSITTESHDGVPVVAVAARGPWVTARWADGTLWRRGPTGEQRAAVGASTTLGLLQQLPGGRACTATGREVACWNTEAAPVTIATLPRPAELWRALDDSRALIVLEDGTHHRIDLETGSVRAVFGDYGPFPFRVRGRGPFVATVMNDRSVVVGDPVSDTSWVAGLTDVRGFPLTTEGGYIVVLQQQPTPHLIVWRSEPAASPEATAQLLDATTNAVFEPSSNRLTWR